MTCKCVFVVLFTVATLASRPSAVAAQPAAPPCPREATPLSPPRHSNIRVDEMLRPLVDALLAKSDTFRRQWNAIGASTLVRVSVLARIGIQDDRSARARGQVSRYAHGSIRATIEIPTGADVTELLAHELEHVIEQLEGLDLPGLARRGGQGVFEIRPGVYETSRARAAGLQVMREVYDGIDPAMGAAFGGIRRLFRSLDQRPAGPGAPAPAPFQPGAHLHKRR